MTNFFSGAEQYTPSVNQLLLDGFKNKTLDQFFLHLPVFGLAILIILVSYSLFTTYHGTLHNLKVSKFYANAKREPISLISIRYIAICSAAFTIPLLYWCFLLAVWYPYFIKLPIKYITAQNLTPLIMAAIGVTIILSLLTHIAIALTRFAAKLFNYALKG